MIGSLAFKSSLVRGGDNNTLFRFEFDADYIASIYIYVQGLKYKGCWLDLVGINEHRNRGPDANVLVLLAPISIAQAARVAE
jgi:hypothetical protein